jgi:hypothetical protein
MANDISDDAVGYKQPPKSTRFKPGQSGNPKGKSKHTRNFRTDLRDELAEQITVRENGRERRVSKQRALVKALVAAAIKGDMRAANAIVTFSTKSFTDADNAPAEALSSDDQDILDAFVDRELKRRRHNDKEAPASSKTNNKKSKKNE